MNEPVHIEPQPTRKFLFGLGCFCGMLMLTFVQSIIQLSMFGCATSLLGILAVFALHRAVERNIPRGVDTISSQAAHLPEDRRIALGDYLEKFDDVDE